MNTKPIIWNGVYITTVDIYDSSDWKGNGNPTDKDFVNVHRYQSVKSLFNAINNQPNCPYPDLTSDKPWIQVLLQLICKTAINKTDTVFEEQVMRLYLEKHGMDQILSTYGVDVEKTKIEIDNMIKSES